MELRNHRDARQIASSLPRTILDDPEPIGVTLNLGGRLIGRSFSDGSSDFRVGRTPNDVVWGFASWSGIVRDEDESPSKGKRAAPGAAPGS